MNYRLYRLDRRGQVSGVPDVLAADSDEQAIALARAVERDASVEIWQAGRLVARLPPSE